MYIYSIVVLRNTSLFLSFLLWTLCISILPLFMLHIYLFILKFGDKRLFRAHVVCLTMYRLWIQFFTLTPTQPCWKPALLQLLGDFKCFPRTIARWMGLGSKPKSGYAPLIAASPRGRMGWRPLTPWWRHQMETFSSLLAPCAGNSPVPVNSPHKGQWRGALMFSFAWINDWVNNREAGDLRRHRGHYDVIVMPTGWPR